MAVIQLWWTLNMSANLKWLQLKNVDCMSSVLFLS